MILLFSGPDNVGKGTQINLVKKYLEEKGKLVHYMHYSSIKGNDIEERSKKYYKQMFDMIKFATFNNINLILDRCHDGETVYGPIYRNYSGDYTYELEERYGNRILENCFLFVFVANPETLISRDDGLSFTTEFEKKSDEIERFKTFGTKSKIKHKAIIDITGKDPDHIFNGEIKICLDTFMELF